MATVREHLASAHEHMAKFHRAMHKAHSGMLGKEGMGAHHEQFHKTAAEAHLAAAEAHDASCQACSKAVADILNETMPTNVSAVVPDNPLRAVVRPGGRPMPNVPAEFASLVSSGDDRDE
jgi:hypothetical protein